MDNSEKLTTQGTQDGKKQSQNTTQYVFDTTMRKQRLAQDNKGCVHEIVVSYIIPWEFYFQRNLPPVNIPFKNNEMIYVVKNHCDVNTDNNDIHVVQCFISSIVLLI